MQQYFQKQIVPKLARGRERKVTGFTLVELLAVLAIIAILTALSAPSLVSVFGGSALSQAGQMIQDQLNLYRQLAVNNNYIVEVRIYNFIDSSIPGDASTTSYTPTGSPPAYDTPGHYRGIQAFKVIPATPPSINTSGQIVFVKTAITKPLRLPPSIIIDAGGSALASASNISALIRTLGSTSSFYAKNLGTPLPLVAPQVPVTGDTSIFDVGLNYTYISFQFNPDGSTNLNTSFNPNTIPSSTYFCVMTLHDRKYKDNLTGGSGGTLAGRNYYTIQIDPYSGRVNAYRP